MTQITKNKKAALISLAIVLGSLAILAATAFLLSGQGNEISGMVPTEIDTCAKIITGPGEYILYNNLDCATYGISIQSSDVDLDCNGNTITYTGSASHKGIAIGSIATPSNITIRNCELQDFVTAIEVGSVGGNLFPAVYVNISKNDIHDNVNGIIVFIGDHISIDNNDFDSMSGAAILIPEQQYAQEDINITRNRFDNNNLDYNIQDGIGIKIGLNHFTGTVDYVPGTDSEPDGLGGDIDFCPELSDGIIRDEFGNFWDGTSPDSYLFGCNHPPPDNGGHLDQDYSEGLLPIRCGAEVLSNLTLTENLRDWAGLGYCGSIDEGLYIKGDNIKLDCNNKEIIGDGSIDIEGIRFDTDDVTITRCKIHGFDRAIQSSTFATTQNAKIYLNELHGNGVGVFMINDDYAKIYANELYDNTYGIWMIAATDANISTNNIHDSSKGIHLPSSGIKDNNFFEYNTFDSNNNGDISVPNSAQNNKFYGNIFNDGIADVGGTGSEFCVNNIGNEYHLDQESRLPPTYDCGSAWVNDTTYCGTLVVKNTYLEANVTATNNCMWFTTENMTLDCQGNSIKKSPPGSDYGAIIDEPRSTLVNCNITGFERCVSIGTDGKNNSISGNIFDCTTRDLYLTSGADGSNISNNAFLSQGAWHFITDNNYCVNDVGNFYQKDVTDIGPNDCGFPDFDEPSFDNSTWTETQGPLISWSAQDSPILLEKYLLGVYHFDNAIPGWYYFNATPTTSIEYHPLSWHPPAADENTFKFNITPVLVSGHLGQTIFSENVIFLRNTDFDNDTYSNFNDCDDSDEEINPGVQERCDITECDTDYNCDGQARWGDPQCDASKNGLNFHPDDFLNDFNCDLEFTDLENVPPVRLNHSSNLTHIQFLSNIDLNGTDLRLIDIDVGHIDVDDQLVGLNTSADIYFYNLPFEKDPAVLYNGEPCPFNKCISLTYDNNADPFPNNENEGVAVMRVSGFSSYTLTNSSRLHIFDQNDSEVGDIAEVYHRLRFYANYSRTMDSVPINNLTVGGYDVAHRGQCNLTVFNWTGLPIPDLTSIQMEYMPFEGLYRFEAAAHNFTQIGTYPYRIKCNSTLYENASVTDSITLVDDITAPVAPTLYPQILLHPTNYTGSIFTEVAGYFGEPDINLSINVLQGMSVYQYQGQSDFSGQDSEWKGESVTTSFNALEGEYVAFVEWNAIREEAFNTYKFIEFSNHNRTYFRRYAIDDVARTGNDIRLQFNESLESDIPIDVNISLFNEPYPAGYFRLTVQLFPSGANRISVWGYDFSGNSGPASDDWINAPFPSTAPPAPVWWNNTPEAVNSNFTLQGYCNDYSLDNLTLSLVIEDGLIRAVKYSNSSKWQWSNLNITRHPSQPRYAGQDFIYISDADYAQIDPLGWTNLWLEIPNHIHTYWERYEVVSTQNLPGEDARIYISPPLLYDINESDLLSFYDTQRRHGFFNITVDTANNLSLGQNNIYGVGISNMTGLNIESPPSSFLNIWYDLTLPEFTFQIPTYYPSNTPTLEFTISDNFKPDPSTLMLNISNSTNHTIYYASDFSCTPAVSNQSQYDCFITLDFLSTGSYNASFYLEDMAGNILTNGAQDQTWYNLTILVDTIQILSVDDYDDITNNLWLYANWTYSPTTNIDHFEYALGSAPYPSVGWNSFKDWNPTCPTPAYWALPANKSIISSSATSAYDIAAMDIDKDGIEDFGLLTLSELSWWKGDGLGNFTKTVVDAFLTSAYDIEVLDFDGDGDVDFVVSSSFSGAYVYYQGAVWIKSPVTAAASKDIEVANLDLDSDNDIISAGSQAPFGLLVHTNNGGTFSSLVYSPGFVYDDFEIFDADSTGRPEIFALRNNGLLEYFSWNGATWALNPIGFGLNQPEDIELFDFNNDGNVDILVSSNSEIAWWPGTGSLGWGSKISIDTSIQDVRDIEIIDFDSDGDADILATSFSQNSFVFYENDGSQSFSKNIVDSSITGSLDTDYIDYDGDGFLEAIVAGYTSSTLALYDFTKNKDCKKDEITITHVNDEAQENETTKKLLSGSVYYFTVRAQNMAQEYGEPKSSDGVLFIDPTPPICMNGNCIIDDGTWTNSDSSLHAEWFFQDNESDIISYEYSIGTAKYPNPEWNNIINRKKIGPTTDITEPNLTLQHVETYYWNVRAQNGNAGIGYNGSWSAWKSSDGITVDLLSPTGGGIYYNHSGSYETVPFVTIQYDTGDDPSPQSGVDYATIVSGRSILQDGQCNPIQNLNFAHYNITVGASYFNFPVESGYCYEFEMRVWDRADNLANYAMANNTLTIVKIDRTPPSTIVNVWDDGFFTFDHNQLHAWWLPQSDLESGMDHYQWKIYQDDTADPYDCNISSMPSYPWINSSYHIHCSLLTEGQLDGNVTNPEVYVNPLNLTNNFKYYFAVTPFDKAGNNATTTFSDGIIYIDNVPPGPLYLYSVNNATLPSSPYLTRNRDGKINITLYGDIDGYADIDSCVLMVEDLDYIENTSYPSVLSICDISRVSSFDEDWERLDSFVMNLTDNEDRNITKINCINATNSTDPFGQATQDIWTWHVSCRDRYWNTQSYTQNTPVWFEVDWIDPPSVSGLDVYTEFGLNLSNETVYCSATVSDLDNDTLTGDVNFTWFVNNELMFTETRSYDDADEVVIPHEYYYLSELDPQFTRRGSEVNCSVTAYDLTNASNSDYQTFTVQNAAPYKFTQLTPINESFRDEVTFAWDGPIDIDSDSITYTIRVDNEGELPDPYNNPIFNISNNRNLSYYPDKAMVTPNIPLVQSNPSVYGDLIAYMDWRDGGGDADIYLYNLNTHVETGVAFLSANERYPKVFDGLVVYEEPDTGFTKALLKAYDISSGLKKIIAQNVKTSVGSVYFDYEGRYVVYQNTSDDIVVYDKYTEETRAIGSSPASSRVSVSGDLVVWAHTNTVYVFDLSENNLKSTFTGLNPKISGPYVLYRNVSNTNLIQVRDLRSGLDILPLNIISLSDDIYGNKVVYQDGSGLNIIDLFSEDFSHHVSVTGSDPAIYDDLIVFELAGEIQIIQENRSFPSYWMLDGQSAIAAYTQSLNTTDDELYFWLIEACDSALEPNSCINATPELPPYTHSFFGVDRTPPNITSMSPPKDAVVAGRFKLFATIEDNLYIPQDMSVHYKVSYLNGTSIFEGPMTMFLGNTWNSLELDFTFLDLEDLNFSVWVNDSVDNTGFRYITFTINNQTPWFDFGNISDTNLSAFHSLIDGDMFAYNAKNSSLKIVGYLPSTTQRFLQSKVELLVSNHNYSDDISVITWPEGAYRVIFAGTNLEPTTNIETREFLVDHNPPEYYDVYPNNTILYANESVILSVNWTDFSLRQVNISHYTSVWETYTENTTSSGNFTKGPIDLEDWIGTFFKWNSTAIDAFGRIVHINSEFFVASNPPVQTATIPNQTILEDASNISPTNLSLYLEDYFQDINLGDTLNFTVYDLDPDLDLDINDTTGEVLHLTGLNDHFGDVIVKLNISDSYGAWIIANFTVHILPVNDSPRWLYPLGPIHTDEDNPGWVLVNLTNNATDVEGDPIEWAVHENTINLNLLNLVWNDTSQGLFNFTLKPDENGEDNITFRITQDDGLHWVDEEIKIIIDPTPDIPTKPAITNMTTSDVPVPPYTPNISSTVLGMIPITWNGSKDPDIETLNYSIEYSINGGSDWNLIVDEYGTIQSSDTSVPTSYAWNSTANLSNQDVIVYLRVNATVGPDEVESDMYGPFAVDNKPSVLTITSPSSDPVDLAQNYVEVQFISDESVECNLTLNSTLLPSAGTVHDVNFTNQQYGKYILNITCTDNQGNTNSTDFTVRLWEFDIEYIDYLVNDTFVVQGDHVNLTLEIFSLNGIDNMTMDLVSPAGLAHHLNMSNFTIPAPIGNTYYPYAIITNTSQLGYYNLTDIWLRNLIWTTDTRAVEPEVFRSVTWVQHQLIVE
ncbi:right-handed parallel beta-helix repeat-containing protein [Nanoarchaeota archaeon]